MQEWEYLAVSEGTTIGYLNELGEQGWELVAANGQRGYSDLYFKRPKS